MANNIAVTAGAGTKIAGIERLFSGENALVQVIAPYLTNAISSAYVRPANTSIYAAGDMWLDNITAGSVTCPSITLARNTDLESFLIRARLKKSGNGILNSTMRLHFFNALPTFTNGDNGVFAAGLTGASWIGSMDGTIDKQFSDVSYGEFTPTNGSAIGFTPVSGAATLYWVPEIRGAYTPASAESLTLYVTAQ